ncbi:putative vacuolar protein sorting-associated protein 13A [Porphyridium purpureum]|uniref:Putative vacuolar protein sorting-associated protein 13A n=1 Tax=Porphyridium purpureum TaxID=35688 RepID=A0A5J4Z3I3_PORPP|nr:putative vacuolar protein sorting-associated protein 13A [Porphyridium purpureum]|eukprot:POR8291..scf295_1
MRQTEAWLRIHSIALRNVACKALGACHNRKTPGGEKMFEGIVADLLTRVLGRYVKGIDRESISLGVWSGTIEFSDLEVQHEALELLFETLGLSLSLQVEAGIVAKLSVLVPWKNLRTQPVQISLNGIRVLARPSKLDALNHVKRNGRVKKAQLDADDALRQTAWMTQSADTAKNATSSTATASHAASSTSARTSRPESSRVGGIADLTSSLMTPIAENVIISVQNVEIVYVDDLSDKEHPFCARLQVNAFSLRNLPIEPDEEAQHARKVLNVESVSLSWSPLPLIQAHRRRDFHGLFAKRVESERDILRDLCGAITLSWVEGPIPDSVSCKDAASHSPSSQNCWTYPRVDISVHFPSAKVEIDEFQYSTLLKAVAWFAETELSQTAFAAPRTLSSPRERWKWVLNVLLPGVSESLKEARLLQPVELRATLDQINRYVMARVELFKALRQNKRPRRDAAAIVERMELDMPFFQITALRDIADFRLQLELRATAVPSSASPPSVVTTEKAEGKQLHGREHGNAVQPPSSFRWNLFRKTKVDQPVSASTRSLSPVQLERENSVGQIDHRVGVTVAVPVKVAPPVEKALATEDIQEFSKSWPSVGDIERNLTSESTHSGAELRNDVVTRSQSREGQGSAMKATQQSVARRPSFVRTASAKSISSSATGTPPLISRETSKTGVVASLSAQPRSHIIPLDLRLSARIDKCLIVLYNGGFPSAKESNRGHMHAASMGSSDACRSSFCELVLDSLGCVFEFGQDTAELGVLLDSWSARDPRQGAEVVYPRMRHRGNHFNHTHHKSEGGNSDFEFSAVQDKDMSAAQRRQDPFCISHTGSLRPRASQVVQEAVDRISAVRTCAGMSVSSGNLDVHDGAASSGPLLAVRLVHTRRQKVEAEFESNEIWCDCCDDNRQSDDESEQFESIAHINEDGKCDKCGLRPNLGLSVALGPMDAVLDGENGAFANVLRFLTPPSEVLPVVSLLSSIAASQLGLLRRQIVLLHHAKNRRAAPVKMHVHFACPRFVLPCSARALLLPTFGDQPAIDRVLQEHGLQAEKDKETQVVLIEMAMLSFTNAMERKPRFESVGYTTVLWSLRDASAWLSARGTQNAVWVRVARNVFAFEWKHAVRLGHVDRVDILAHRLNANDAVLAVSSDSNMGTKQEYATTNVVDVSTVDFAATTDKLRELAQWSFLRSVYLQISSRFKRKTPTFLPHDMSNQAGTSGLAPTSEASWVAVYEAAVRRTYLPIFYAHQLHSSQKISGSGGSAEAREREIAATAAAKIGKWSFTCRISSIRASLKQSTSDYSSRMGSPSGKVCSLHLNRVSSMLHSLKGPARISGNFSVESILLNDSTRHSLAPQGELFRGTGTGNSIATLEAPGPFLKLAIDESMQSYVLELARIQIHCVKESWLKIAKLLFEARRESIVPKDRQVHSELREKHGGAWLNENSSSVTVRIAAFFEARTRFVAKCRIDESTISFLSPCGLIGQTVISGAFFSAGFVSVSRSNDEHIQLTGSLDSIIVRDVTTRVEDHEEVFKYVRDKTLTGRLSDQITFTLPRTMLCAWMYRRDEHDKDGISTRGETGSKADVVDGPAASVYVLLSGVRVVYLQRSASLLRTFLMDIFEAFQDLAWEDQLIKTQSNQCSTNFFDGIFPALPVLPPALAHSPISTPAFTQASAWERRKSFPLSFEFVLKDLGVMMPRHSYNEHEALVLFMKQCSVKSESTPSAGYCVSIGITVSGLDGYVEYTAEATTDPGLSSSAAWQWESDDMEKQLQQARARGMQRVSWGAWNSQSRGGTSSNVRPRPSRFLLNHDMELKVDMFRVVPLPQNASAQKSARENDVFGVEFVIGLLMEQGLVVDQADEFGTKDVLVAQNRYLPVLRVRCVGTSELTLVMSEAEYSIMYFVATENFTERAHGIAFGTEVTNHDFDLTEGVQGRRLPSYFRPEQQIVGMIPSIKVEIVRGDRNASIGRLAATSLCKVHVTNATFVASLEVGSKLMVELHADLDRVVDTRSVDGEDGEGQSCSGAFATTVVRSASQSPSRVPNRSLCFRYSRPFEHAPELVGELQGLSALVLSDFMATVAFDLCIPGDAFLLTTPESPTCVFRGRSAVLTLKQCDCWLPVEQALPEDREIGIDPRALVLDTEAVALKVLWEPGTRERTYDLRVCGFECAVSMLPSFFLSGKGQVLPGWDEESRGASLSADQFQKQQALHFELGMSSAGMGVENCMDALPGTGAVPDRTAGVLDEETLSRNFGIHPDVYPAVHQTHRRSVSIVPGNQAAAMAGSVAAGAQSKVPIVYPCELFFISDLSAHEFVRENGLRGADGKSLATNPQLCRRLRASASQVTVCVDLADVHLLLAVARRLAKPLTDFDSQGKRLSAAKSHAPDVSAAASVARPAVGFQVGLSITMLQLLLTKSSLGRMPKPAAPALSWTPQRPLLEMAVPSFEVHASTSGSSPSQALMDFQIRLQCTCALNLYRDLLGDWVPFVEPWTFSARLGRSSSKSERVVVAEDLSNAAAMPSRLVNGRISSHNHLDVNLTPLAVSVMVQITEALREAGKPWGRNGAALPPPTAISNRLRSSYRTSCFFVENKTGRSFALSFHHNPRRVALRPNDSAEINLPIAGSAQQQAFLIWMLSGMHSRPRASFLNSQEVQVRPEDYLCCNLLLPGYETARLSVSNPGLKRVRLAPVIQDSTAQASPAGSRSSARKKAVAPPLEFVWEVRIENGIPRGVLRSLLTLTNQTNSVLQVLLGEGSQALCHTIAPACTFHVPILWVERSVRVRPLVEDGRKELGTLHHRHAADQAQQQKPTRLGVSATGRTCELEASLECREYKPSSSASSGDGRILAGSMSDLNLLRMHHATAGVSGNSSAGDISDVIHAGVDQDDVQKSLHFYDWSHPLPRVSSLSSAAEAGSSFLQRQRPAAASGSSRYGKRQGSMHFERAALFVSCKRSIEDRSTWGTVAGDAEETTAADLMNSDNGMQLRMGAESYSKTATDEQKDTGPLKNQGKVQKFQQRQQIPDFHLTLVPVLGAVGTLDVALCAPLSFRNLLPRPLMLQIKQKARAGQVVVGDRDRERRHHDAHVGRRHEDLYVCRALVYIQPFQTVRVHAFSPLETSLYVSGCYSNMNEKAVENASDSTLLESWCRFGTLASLAAKAASIEVEPPLNSDTDAPSGPAAVLGASTKRDKPLAPPYHTAAALVVHFDTSGSEDDINSSIGTNEKVFYAKFWIRNRSVLPVRCRDRSRQKLNGVVELIPHSLLSTRSPHSPSEEFLCLSGPFVAFQGMKGAPLVLPGGDTGMVERAHFANRDILSASTSSARAPESNKRWVSLPYELWDIDKAVYFNVSGWDMVLEVVPGNGELYRSTMATIRCPWWIGNLTSHDLEWRPALSSASLSSSSTSSSSAGYSGGLTARGHAAQEHPVPSMSWRPVQVSSFSRERSIQIRIRDQDRDIASAWEWSNPVQLRADAGATLFLKLYHPKTHGQYIAELAIQDLRGGARGILVHAQDPDSPPYRIVNACADHDIAFCQIDPQHGYNSGSAARPFWLVHPGHSTRYAWDEPHVRHRLLAVQIISRVPEHSALVPTAEFEISIDIVSALILLKAGSAWKVFVQVVDSTKVVTIQDACEDDLQGASPTAGTSASHMTRAAVFVDLDVESSRSVLKRQFSSHVQTTLGPGLSVKKMSVDSERGFRRGIPTLPASTGGGRGEESESRALPTGMVEEPSHSLLQNFQFLVDLWLPSVGLSIVDLGGLQWSPSPQAANARIQHDEELLYVLATGVEFTAESRWGCESVVASFSIADLQMDNVLPAATWGVALWFPADRGSASVSVSQSRGANTGRRKSNSLLKRVSSDMHSAGGWQWWMRASRQGRPVIRVVLEMLVTDNMWRHGDKVVPRTVMIKNIRSQVYPLVIQLDEEIVARCSHLIFQLDTLCKESPSTPISSACASYPVATPTLVEVDSTCEPMHSNLSSISPLADGSIGSSAARKAQSTLVYIEHVLVSNIEIDLSFASSSRRESQLRFKTEANALIRALLATVGNVEKAALIFHALELSHVFDSSAHLQHLFKEYYVQQLDRQKMTLVASNQLLGNPSGLFNSIAMGARDFFAEPARVSSQGGSFDFLAGIGRGSSSLLTSTLGGILNSVAGIPRAVAMGLEVALGDSEFLAERESIRSLHRQAPSPASGLVTGVLCFGHGVASGTVGLFRDPVLGAQQDGINGLVAGMWHGVAGLAIKPLTGVLDLVSQPISGIHSVVRSSRFRFHRGTGSAGSPSTFTITQASTCDCSAVISASEHRGEKYPDAAATHHLMKTFCCLCAFCDVPLLIRPARSGLVLGSGSTSGRGSSYAADHPRLRRYDFHMALGADLLSAAQRSESGAVGSGGVGSGSSESVLNWVALLNTREELDYHLADVIAAHLSARSHYRDDGNFDLDAFKVRVETKISREILEVLWLIRVHLDLVRSIPDTPAAASKPSWDIVLAHAPSCGALVLRRAAESAGVVEPADVRFAVMTSSRLLIVTLNGALVWQCGLERIAEVRALRGSGAGNDIALFVLFAHESFPAPLPIKRTRQDASASRSMSSLSLESHVQTVNCGSVRARDDLIAMVRAELLHRLQDRGKVSFAGADDRASEMQDLSMLGAVRRDSSSHVLDILRDEKDVRSKKLGPLVSDSKASVGGAIGVDSAFTTWPGRRGFKPLIGVHAVRLADDEARECARLSASVRALTLGAPLGMIAARSLRIVLVNGTNSLFSLVDMQCEHGVWHSPPPARLRAHSVALGEVYLSASYLEDVRLFLLYEFSDTDGYGSSDHRATELLVLACVSAALVPNSYVARSSCMSLTVQHELGQGDHATVLFTMRRLNSEPHDAPGRRLDLRLIPRGRNSSRSLMYDLLPKRSSSSFVRNRSAPSLVRAFGSPTPIASSFQTTHVGNLGLSARDPRQFRVAEAGAAFGPASDWDARKWQREILQRKRESLLLELLSLGFLEDEVRAALVNVQAGDTLADILQVLTRAPCRYYPM